MLRYATFGLWRIIMACNAECTPCLGPEVHIARHKLSPLSWGSMWRAIRYRIKSQGCGRHTCLEREAQIRPAEGELGGRRVRCLARGEEPVAGRRVTPRQMPPRRRHPLCRLSQTIGGAPVRRQPGQRGGMARSQRQNGRRHRQQLLQVKRAGPAAPDLSPCDIGRTGRRSLMLGSLK